jgi:hypothetical protein
LEEFLSSEYYEKLQKFKIANAVNQSDDKTWCPVSDCCSVANIRGGNMFGECTECGFRFCLICKSWYHSGRRCPVLTIGVGVFGRMSKREQEDFIQEQLAELYVMKYTKNCPK